MRELAFALFLLLPLAACARSAPLEVTNVWARDSIGGAATAAVYMTIASPTPDRLIGASTPIAAKTDLMTMQNDSGQMAMIYIDAIDIPANTPVSLDPSGLHVWLANLSEPLRAGETFPLVLRFENAGEREVIVSIIAPTAAPPMAEMEM